MPACSAWGDRDCSLPAGVSSTQHTVTCGGAQKGGETDGRVRAPFPPPGRAPRTLIGTGREEGSAGRASAGPRPRDSGSAGWSVVIHAGLGGRWLLGPDNIFGGKRFAFGPRRWCPPSTWKAGLAI